jgi:hypothetical protein
MEELNTMGDTKPLSDNARSAIKAFLAGLASDEEESKEQKSPEINEKSLVCIL